MFALTWCLLLYISARCYAFDLQVNETMTWPEAFKFCRSKEMELVAIDSEEENAALAEHGIKTGFFAPFNGAWTSGCFQPFQGDYVWFSTGTVVNYKKWAASHPLVAAADHCITFYPPDPQWIEAPTSIYRPVICESPIYIHN
ncbi:hypothetical protein B566_EDAN017881 [Ephemera danica]|nr:hypothetical protein B566_EDAN017881 [Ephemera danica]